jgi:hypothetical protein
VIVGPHHALAIALGDALDDPTAAARTLQQLETLPAAATTCFCDLYGSRRAAHLSLFDDSDLADIDRTPAGVFLDD